MAGRRAGERLRNTVAAAALVALMGVGGLLGADGLVGWPASMPAGAMAVPRQTEVSTPVTPEVGEGTGADEVEPMPPQPTLGDPGSSQRAADADSRRVWLIVYALVAVALALAIVTIVFWRRTRPSRHDSPRHAKGARPPTVPTNWRPPPSKADEPAPAEDEDDDTGDGRRKRRRRRSERD